MVVRAHVSIDGRADMDMHTCVRTGHDGRGLDLELQLAAVVHPRACRQVMMIMNRSVKAASPSMRGHAIHAHPTRFQVHSTKFNKHALCTAAFSFQGAMEMPIRFPPRSLYQGGERFGQSSQSLDLLLMWVGVEWV